MQTQPIHWHEGMFLRPQHFQLSTRHVKSQSDRGDKWNRHYNWGLRTFALDQQALSNYRFSIRALEARFRDGTQIAVPDDLSLPTLDLKPALAQNGHTTVFLALPLVQASRSNVSETVEGVPPGTLLMFKIYKTKTRGSIIIKLKFGVSTSNC